MRRKWRKLLLDRGGRDDDYLVSGRRIVFRNTGAEYVGVSGKAVQARRIGPACKTASFWEVLGLADYNV